MILYMCSLPPHVAGEVFNKTYENLRWCKWSNRRYEGHLNELSGIEVASGGWPAGHCNIGGEECAIKWTSYSDIRYIGLRVILPSGVTVFPPPLSLSHSLTHFLIEWHWIMCNKRMAIISNTKQNTSTKCSYWNSKWMLVSFVNCSKTSNENV